MEAGVLRDRIELWKRVEEQDSTGELLTVFKLYKKVWAKVTPVSGREFIVGGQEQSKVMARILIRYNEKVDNSYRIKHKNKTYNIEAVLEDNVTGTIWQNLMCSEGIR